MMPIPSFNLDGVLPPFLGPDPGREPGLMTPYRVSLAEVVHEFATTSERRQILAGWIQYRRALRSVGFRKGFQWLDGSFLEDKERLKGMPPGDLDLIFFFRRPEGAKKLPRFQAFAMANRALLTRDLVKSAYHLDTFRIDLDANVENIVASTRYYLLLFAHQRDTYIWKGMLEVSQEDDKEEASLLNALLSSTTGATS